MRGPHRRIDRDLEAPVHDRVARRRERARSRRAGVRASPRAAPEAREPLRRSRPRPRERATSAAAARPRRARPASARRARRPPRPGRHGADGLRAAARKPLGRARRTGRAESRDRTDRARGAPRRADLLAEVHERGREVAGISRGQEGRDAPPQELGMRSRPRFAPNGEESRDHARHVGVERRHPRAERQRRHGGGQVVAESRQRRECRRVARKPPAVRRDDASRGGVQVPGPGVVPEARPGRQHARFPRPGERRQVRKTSEEHVVPSGDRGHGRLLEHDLRNPDPVRIPGPAPGEPPLFSAKPGEQCGPDRGCRAAFVQEAVVRRPSPRCAARSSSAPA